MLALHCLCIREINFQSYFSDHSINSINVTATEHQTPALLKTCWMKN